MIYSEIIERVIQGVLRLNPTASRAALAMQIDAGFPQVNNQVSEEYAKNEDARAVLRKNVTLTFVGGVITFPGNVLRKYLKDATLVLSTGEVATLIESYSDYVRVLDGRLPYWNFNNAALNAKNSATNGGTAYAGAATLTCIASPDVPTLATDTFVAPDDYLPDLIEALITYCIGKPANAAAVETT